MREQKATFQIDPNKGRLISLAQLPAYMEKLTGKRAHRSAIYRWRQRGVRGPDGVVYRLPTIKFGGASYTHPDAIAWWTSATSGTLPEFETALAARASADDDEATLRRAGIA